MAEGYSAPENQRVSAANGVSYACRDACTGGNDGARRAGQRPSLDAP